MYRNPLAARKKYSKHYKGQTHLPGNYSTRKKSQEDNNDIQYRQTDRKEPLGSTKAKRKENGRENSIISSAFFDRDHQQLMIKLTTSQETTYS